MTKFSVSMKFLAASAGAAFVFASSPSQAAVINIDDFTGWQQIGNVSFNNAAAFLTSNGAFDNEIESFLGLASGALDSFNGVNATNGSAIQKAITVQAGDVLNFKWNFKANDYLPFNDFSFYSIGSSLFKLADIAQVGNFGQKTSQTSYSFTTAGTYNIGFGVVNAQDTVASSNLNVGDVPEPLTILGTLTAGSFGVALRRKYKQQKATAKA